MIKILVTILLALPLLSIAPVPRAHMETGSRPLVTRHSSLARTQACTWETAPARLRQQIEDPIGYPFGMVEAWSCSGDSQAVIAELQTRANAMQLEAAIYRAAHPITGATK